MKFKITLRNKFNAEITTAVVEADNEQDLKDEYTTEATQFLSARPIRYIGQKPEKPVKSTYVSVKRLRARVERDLCNKQMKLGKYSPEAIEAELRRELAQELGE
jgi:hypothetical protein